ncbi:MAG TPA: immune inhibitor A [Verrucomicrobiota bacterium]|nr:immune inhibitor A [Verrucomicrobiota bacterium]HPO43438.1 immune inhibitor A [Verrucomicrobiota bacterium]
MSHWTASGTWGLTTTHYGSPSHAVTDSPGTFYTNNTHSALTLAASLSLAGAVRPALGFQHRYALETGYDFGRVEVSVDGGNSWVSPELAAYTGQQGTLAREQLDLSAYAGVADFRLRFRLATDSSVVMDGWYVDDVVIAEAPAPVTLTATATNRNSIGLAWTPSAAADFAAYRLYRSLTPGLDWRTARVIAEGNASATTNVTDLTASPKTTYYYRVAVVNTRGLLTLGNEIAVTTHPGMDYPFTDNGEGGPNIWVAEAPWALSSEDALSPEHGWSDSPGANYANNITSQALTLAAPLFLAGQASAPVFSFYHKYDFASGDSGNAEVSLNNGTDWTSLASFTGTSSNQWRRARFSLAPYSNAVSVLLRFRITTDSATQGDGWHLDDISVAESPAVVNAPVLDQITSHTIRVSWAAAAGDMFSHYAVFRSTTPGVGINSTLVATIPDRNLTVFTDANLALDTVYYYRVYAVNSYGAFSPDSPTESSARTLNNPLPFTEDFEGSLQGWNLTGTWGIATNDAHSGLACLADSPGFNYANSSDSYALTAVNLVGTTWPVLRFWDRYRLADNDWARLEVSTDGNSWTPIYGAAGIRAEWAEQSIDLSPWKNQSNLRLRFHLWTDWSTTEDGWSIDDLTVAEHAPAALALPFYETFEAGLDQWLHASWARDTNGAYGGQYAVRDTPSGRMNPDTTYWLGLGSPLNLSNAVNPQLVFWVKGQLPYRSRFRVHYSTDDGLNWGELYGLNYEWDQGWTRAQVSLQSLVNRLVRLRFATWNEYGSAPAEDLWIDNLAIEESPPPVALYPLTEITPASMRLDWTEAAIGNFKEYRIYRSETPNVSESSTLLAVITNQAATTFVDGGLMARKTYYYRVYLHNHYDDSVGSNQSSATTAGVELPWVADFETPQPGWTFTGTWTLWPGAGRNGSVALADSPGDYPNYSSHYAQFAADLRGSVWPVLRFWDRHFITAGDWGRVFISGDGGASWTRVYGVSATRTNWAEQSVDLSPWKNSSQVWVRFQMNTGGNPPSDGWYLDDISLGEHSPAPAAYPFHETFEAGLDHWLHPVWTVDTNQPFAGQYAVRDTVFPWMPPDTQLALVLGRELNLSNAVNPILTFRARGQLWYRTRFRAQVSTDGGLVWNDLVALNNDWNQPWTRFQASLANYLNQTIRLRFIVWSEYGSAPDQDLFLDDIGIGEPAPGAPILAAPANLASVPVVRPILSVTNAVDYQGDSLSYRFEVYADAALSNLVAQVPLVSAGTAITSWTVDTDLPDNAQYWWRCQATDGTNTGPWMATATFFVNEINHAPAAPEIAGPPSGVLVTNLEARLFWFPSAGDPDEGDRVATYHIQVAADLAFTAPVINATGIVAVAVPPGGNWVLSLPLQELPGAQNLVLGTRYYWRVSAQDLRGLSSDWSAGEAAFQFGKVIPAPATLTGLRRGPNGTMSLEWEGAAGELYVEFSLSLTTPNWLTIAGPLQGTNWTFTPVPGSPSGFFRVRSQ